MQSIDLGWLGPVYTEYHAHVDWVLLESGKSNKGEVFGRLCLQLVCRHILPLSAENSAAYDGK
jgi:hypothetical protein